MAFLRAVFGKGPSTPTPQSLGEATDDRFGILSGVAERSSELIVITDAAGIVLYANPVALEIFHLSATESLGTQAFAYLHPDDATRVTERFDELIRTPGASLTDEVRVVTDENRIYDIEIVATNCLDTEIAGIVINGHDVSEGRRLVEGLQARDHWHDALISNFTGIITILDDRGRTLYVSAANEKISGYSPEARLDHDAFELVHPDDLEIATRIFEDVVKNGGSSQPTVVRLGTADGQWRLMEVVVTNRLHDKAVGGIIVNGHDVTERTYLSRALETLTQGNQVLVRATDEASLLKDICQTIVESGHYQLAWVGFAHDDPELTVTPVAAAGRTGYLDETRYSWADDDYGHGPTGAAIRTGSVQVLDDIRLSEELQPWRDAAERHGLRTGCAIPLIIEDSTIGALVIYSSEPGTFGTAEVELLGELANDLSYGIHRLRDASRLAENENVLRESELRFRLAFEQNMAPMLFVDLHDCIIAANEAFCHMLGYASSELVGKDSKHFTHPDDVGITEESWRHVSSGDVDQERYVKRYIRSDGEVLIVEVLRSLARDADGNALYYVISERDVTEERSLTARIYHQELHDPLTGLANRVLFEDRLIQAHARAQRTGTSGAVVLIDIDDFKGVNDTHGLAFGDQVLVAIARRLESVKRPSDTLSRLGGDGFLYLAEGLGLESEAEEVAVMLLNAIADPFTVGDVRVELRASAGVVVWDGTSRSPNEFIRDADVAVDEAKSLGRARHVVFTPLMHEQAINRFAIVQDLHQALEHDEIVMHYQPIFDLATAEIVGYEALMRWHHPEHGWVAPSEFIPLAEQSGMILELGDLALRAATTDASSWPASGTTGERPFVTVNLSASQFHDPRLVATIEGVLATSAIAPARLVIEITEGVLLSDTSETTNVLGRLHEIGVHFALDDFGTGFSSLSYLALLHPRIIKIDQSFVRLARPSSRNDALLETIISLGDKLGITTLAEGIETVAQYRHLRRLGCGLGQGFLFSPAVANQDLAALHFTVPVA